MKMPLLDEAVSKSLIDFVEGESADFAFNGWAKSLVKRRCFRAVGLNHILDGTGIAFADLFNNQDYKETAIAAVPASWKRDFPTEDAGWSYFKKDQLTDAHRSKPIRLDKACIAILIFCVALDENNIVAPDFFKLVWLRPQIYFVEGFNHEFYLKNIDGRPIEDKLIAFTGQDTGNNLHRIANNYLVTKRTAKKVVDFLQPNYANIRRVVHHREPSLFHKDEIIEYFPSDYVKAPDPAAQRGSP